MNGKAAQLERWLMAIRQRALVRSGDLVGQVPCEGSHCTTWCPGCGAQV